VSGADQATDARTTGTVKWFNDAKGFIVSTTNAKTGVVTAIDPATKQQIQFRAPSTVLARLAAGQKVWANFDDQKVSVDGAVPCCNMVVMATRP
jgi:cold shock CspA family protein